MSCGGACDRGSLTLCTLLRRWRGNSAHADDDGADNVYLFGADIMEKHIFGCTDSGCGTCKSDATERRSTHTRDGRVALVSQLWAAAVAVCVYGYADRLWCDACLLAVLPPTHTPAPHAHTHAHSLAAVALHAAQLPGASLPPVITPTPLSRAGHAHHRHHSGMGAFCCPCIAVGRNAAVAGAFGLSGVCGALAGCLWWCACPCVAGPFVRSSVQRYVGSVSRVSRWLRVTQAVLLGG